MPRCNYIRCESEAQHAGGHFQYCKEHHLEIIPNNKSYRQIVGAWIILPETVTDAQNAVMEASIQHMAKLEAMMKLQDAQLRGEKVDPAVKERVFRERFDAMDKWVYLRDVHAELVRAARERERIQWATFKRRGRDVAEEIRRLDAELLVAHQEPLNDINARMTREFAM
jgi:hypothetical protein